MSLILPGIINRSRSVCHLHPIQGLVVIYMPSYFFTTMVFLNVKRAQRFLQTLLVESKNFTVRISRKKVLKFFNICLKNVLDGRCFSYPINLTSVSNVYFRKRERERVRREMHLYLYDKLPHQGKINIACERLFYRCL